MPSSTQSLMKYLLITSQICLPYIVGMVSTQICLSQLHKFCSEEDLSAISLSFGQLLPPTLPLAYLIQASENMKSIQIKHHFSAI
jgi:hypothetical protein